MKRSNITILICLLMIGVLFAGEIKTVIRNNIHFRKGPGSYYPIISVLSKGQNVEVLSSKNRWVNIQQGSETGWVSDNALSVKPIKESSIPTDFDFGEKEQISSVSAGGAIKGFAQKYIASNASYSKYMDVLSKTYVDAGEYERLRDDMYKSSKANRKRYKKLLKHTKNFHISNFLENIGLAVAAQIASQGLSTDKKQLTYLNTIGTLILEQTDLHYYPMKFFIVNDDRPAAYATPNGMIFVTKGLLDITADEAELACLLGHEISHVICQHGYEELQKRSTMIKADDAFSDMDNEINEEDPVANELETISLQIYENATAPRQLGYEYEADKMGAIFACRAGYDPYALVKLLSRIKQSTTMDYENFESNWETYYIKDRIKRVSHFINKNLERNNIKKRQRFQSVFN